MILETVVVGDLQTNCYIAGCEETREAIVIDPGDQADLILARILARDLRVVLIVNTHGHFDHVGANGPVQDLTGAPTAIHPADTELAAEAPNIAMFYFGSPTPAVPAFERLLRAGDTVAAGTLSFAVLETPGHSPGGICLHGHGIVFTGDTLFAGSIGRSDFPESNSAALLRSLYEQVLPLPDEVIVYPGHGPSSTIGAERRMNPFLQSARP